MLVILNMALRNLREHKTKSLIIGSILGLGAAVMVIGSSMIDTATAGMRESFVENYTGDLMISAKKNMSIFGTLGFDTGDSLPQISGYQKLETSVKAIPGVRSVTPLLTGRAGATFLEGKNVPVQLFGVDPESYAAMFPGNIEMLSGRMLQPGEEGIVLSESVAKGIKSADGTPVQAGDSILLSSSNSATGVKVRKMTVRGIFHFIRSNQYLDTANLIDADDLRIMLGMTAAEESGANNMGNTDGANGTEGAASTISAAGTENGDFEQDLFSGGLVQTGTLAVSPDIYNILGSGPREESKPDPNGWHMLLVRIDDTADSGNVEQAIRSTLPDLGDKLYIDDWMMAAGPVGRMAEAIHIVFMIILIVVAVVALVVIMNTFVLSIIERIPEFGTMRAIGAQKSLIFRMIFIESTTNCLLFGLIGIIVGSLVILVLGAFGIQAPNEYFQILFGGPSLHPALSVASVGESLAAILIVGFIASIYPTSIALKVRPAVAMGGK